MVRRIWLLFGAGLLLLGWAGYAQEGASNLPSGDPYADRPGRHVLPNARVREIPPQNYRVAPSRAPQSGARWRKGGLFDPNEFHRNLQNRQRRTRAPRWDRDITNSATDELHPVYNPGAAKIYFSSNASAVVNGRLANPTPYYRIWRGDIDDGSGPGLGNVANPTAITGDTPDERFGSQIQPALNEAANLLAYANRTASGNYNIVVRNLSTGRRVVITADNDGITQNLRPTLSPDGSLVVFASNRLLPTDPPGTERRFRLYLARTDGRPFENNEYFRRLTDPPAGFNDVEPAWSPDGTRIAFARVASDGSSSIFILDFGTLRETRWTNFVDPNTGNRASDRQPSWATFNGVPILVFSSTRKSGDPHRIAAPADRVDSTNRIYDIYRIEATLPEELGGGPAISISADRSTPQLAQPDVPYLTTPPFAPAAGAKYPTGAVDERNRVAYHSPRTEGAEPPGPGIHDLWETQLFDVTPPILEVLPIVRPKEGFPGEEVTIRVRVVDFQSGVDFVRVQFKDPDSAEQDAEGLEHRIYLLFPFDPSFPNRILVEQISGAYVPLFVEVGHQAINPNTYEYKDPYTLVRLGFDGSLDDTLLLTPVLDEQDNPTNFYEGKWRTPDVPSDFYVDVIVRDRAGNEFIYDNITGFTTRPFVGANNILLVSDYMGGQIFVQHRIDVIGNSVARPTWQPVESYWTDNPTGKFPFDLTQPPSGTPQIIIGDGAIPHPRVLGAFVRSDTLGENTTYGNLYDIWRVQCRNPIRPSVLAGYLPRIEREPTDLEGTFRDKLHAPRIVIWASPYTGNLWAGPGHLLDPEVQQLLRDFLNSSGRLVISGQDIAWALTLGGTATSQFLRNELQAQLDSDVAEDIFLVAYQGLRRELTSSGLETDPITGDPNPIARNPAALPIWVRLEGNVFVVDRPETLRLSHPGNYYITPFGDFIDVVVPVGATTTTPLFTDAAWNQVWPDTVLANPDNRAPYRYASPGQLADQQRQRAGTYYHNTTNRSKVVFFSFGVEGVNSGYSQGPADFLWCRALRNKVLHNAFAWLTHGVIQGTVREYDPERRTYLPLRRALVRATALTPPSIAGRVEGYAITDSNGFYRIVGLEAGIYIVDAVRPGYRIQHPESVTVVASTVTLNLVMLKVPPGQISGRVIDINNQPVRGAVVRATSAEDPELAPIETFTDPDGNFLLTRVPVGRWNVTVVDLAFGGYRLPPVQPPGGVYRDVVVRSNETTNVGDFVLEPLPGTVQGVVTDADTGQPIAGARITAIAGTTTRAETTTGTDGRYSFEVPAGEYVVTATAPGYTAVSETLSVRANETTTLNFQLRRLPPGEVVGRIVRRFSGTPEPGVTVRILFNESDVVPSVVTNANGEFRFTNVPPGEYVVRPSKPGFTFIPSQRTVVVEPGQRVTVPEFKAEPLRTFFRGRALVSAPYDYAQDVRALLNVPANATFRFFTWDPEQARYVFYPVAPADRFQLGRGYFLETSIDLALSVEGTPADRTRPFEIPVRAGWNLIGNPFPFDIDWTRIQVIDPDTNAPVALPVAVGKGIVANTLWGFTFGSYTPTTRMRVWEGYWVYAYRDTRLLIPPTAEATRGQSTSVAAAGEWRLTIEAQAGEFKDRVYLGVSRAATVGYDREYDLLKPPPAAGDTVYISIPRLTWGAHSGSYGVDIQPISRSASWEFTVETRQPNQEVTLRWPDAQQLPRTVNLVLVNLQTGERRYLRTTSAYTFRTDTNGIGRFRLETAPVSRLLRIQQAQVLAGRGNQYTITFQLTGDATVEVNILSGGKVVRQLLHQATRSGGLQQATWDGRDQSGIALPPGTYIVEIRAVSDDGQVARATVPLVLTR